MSEQNFYKAKKFNLSGLNGISDQTLEMHLGLYEGYVKNTNLLNEQLLEMAKEKKTSGANPVFAELKRRMGFECGGMVLHEYYFGNLAPKGKGDLSTQLKQAVERAYGSVDGWKADFVAVGSMRGVGWAVLYQDPSTGQVANHWIDLHQQGVPSGFKPILVMDVWEHAFLLDYKPSQRSNYIEAFFSNIDWDAANRCFSSAAAMRSAA